MKMRSTQEPLHRDNDPASLREQLEALEIRGLKITRPAPYHIKVGPLNWYWNSGTIVIDPCEVHSSKGFEAFVELIDGATRKLAPANRRVFYG